MSESERSFVVVVVVVVLSSIRSPPVIELRPGRHWIGGERGGKGGAMRAYQKWFWHDSISCDRQLSRRMRSFLFC